MNINIVIIENESNELEHLKNELNIWSSEKSIPITLSSYSSGEDYFSKSQKHTADLYLLDIQLNGMNGMEIAKKLRSECYSGSIIFLTSYREFVFEGYQVHALNYLLKPLDICSLHLCLNEVSDTLTKKHYIFRNKQEIVQIEYRNILLFSSYLHNVEILTNSGIFNQYATLNNILTHLPKEFVRVHRSYIVNMTHIHKISGSIITLSNHIEIPIGRKYLNSIRTVFSEYSTRFEIIQ